MIDLKKISLLLLTLLFIFSLGTNSFATTVPKIYVEAPYYVDVGEEFSIDVEIRVDDSNRIDEVTVEGTTARSAFRLPIPSDNLQFSFSASIEEDTTYKVVVKYDGVNTITKYITVKTKI